MGVRQENVQVRTPMGMYNVLAHGACSYVARRESEQRNEILGYDLDIAHQMLAIMNVPLGMK